MILINLSHFYFLAKDFSLNIVYWSLDIDFFSEMAKIFIWRELCLRFVIHTLVFILFEKTGNSWCIFSTFFSRFHKTKTRTFKKESERQFPPSRPRLNSMFVKFHRLKQIIKLDIVGQTIK